MSFNMKKLKSALSMASLKTVMSDKQLKNKSDSTISIRSISLPENFYHILLGSGGILCKTRFASTSGPVSYIGATVCLNTVGVFFEISDTQCFAAHIDAYITRPSSEDPQRKHYDTNFQTAPQLRAQVISRLCAALPGKKTKRMRDTLILTCARVSGQEPQAAEIVAKTVRGWLSAEVKGTRVAADGAAFVAGWPESGSLVFSQAPEEGWLAVDCGIGDGEWSFGVEEKIIEESEEAW